MEYWLLLGLLLLLVFFESCKKCSCAYFAASPTPNRLSTAPQDQPDDKFAEDDEEILILRQLPTGKTFEYNYVRAPLNKSIGVYIRRADTGAQITNFAPIANLKTNYKIDDLLTDHNFYAGGAGLNYYIKFLSSASLADETAKQQARHEQDRQYALCLKTNNSISRTQAAEKCTKLYPSINIFTK